MIPLAPTAVTLESNVPTNKFTLESSAVLTCLATGGQDYTFKDAADSVVQAKSTSNTYTISSFSTSSAQDYTCEASNEAGDTASAPLTLILSES